MTIEQRVLESLGQKLAGMSVDDLVALISEVCGTGSRIENMARVEYNRRKI